MEHTPKHKHYFEWEIHTPPQTNPNNSVGLQIATRTEVGIGTGNHLPVQSEPDQSNFGGTSFFCRLGSFWSLHCDFRSRSGPFKRHSLSLALVPVPVCSAPGTALLSNGHVRSGVGSQEDGPRPFLSQCS